MVRECVWKMNESVYYYYILLFLYFDCILNRYIMLGRGICEKYQSRDEKWLNKQYLLFVVFRNILFLLFVTWQGLNFFSLCRSICENVFHFFTLTCRKLLNSFGILQPLSNKTNRNTTTVPAAVKMNEINPKYDNTRKIHRLLTNQNPGFLYKV
jgi:hypothetical protein